MSYDEPDFLMISGIQHYQFCPRQWALDHVEQQWQDNYLTTAGQAVHKRVHDGAIKEKRGDLIVVRGLPVHSREFGIYGFCDAVEFRRDEQGVPISGYSGLYKAQPVEYKHGHFKKDQSDQLQLLAEAVCLEEMLVTKIDSGYLYFNETHQRQQITFDPSLRLLLQQVVGEMHQLWQRHYTPRAHPSKKCQRCSLKEICLPELAEQEQVSAYLQRRLTP